jgi:hypothetical protein
MKTINMQTAERILGWERIDPSKPLYMKPGVSAGASQLCPDFLMSSTALTLLTEEMSRRGWPLTVRHKQVSWENNEGNMWTAVFQSTRQQFEFESTQSDKNTAVCVAALLTLGVSDYSSISSSSEESTPSCSS